MKNIDLTIKGTSVVLILGSALVLAEAYYLLLEAFSFSFESESILYLISYSILLLLGLWLILHRDMNVHLCIFLCGTALGFSTILQNLLFLDYAYDIDVILAFLTLLLGIAEIGFSVAYLFEYRRYVVKICVAAGVQMLMIIIPFFIDWYNRITWAEMFLEYSSILPIMFVNAVFIWILTRRGIWVPFPTKRIEYNLEALEPVLHSDKNMYITPDSLNMLLDKSSWAVFDVGPVEKELRLNLLGGDNGVRVLFQQMRGDPILHGRIIPYNRGQFMQGHHFDVVQMIVSPERDNLRIYGNDGVFINILVREPPVEKEDFMARIHHHLPKLRHDDDLDDQVKP